MFNLWKVIVTVTLVTQKIRKFYILFYAKNKMYYSIDKGVVVAVYYMCACFVRFGALFYRFIFFQSIQGVERKRNVSPIYCFI